MSGIYGIVSKTHCTDSLFYGTDYHSHLGTEFGGLAVMEGEKFSRQIHGISQSQFKSKFFDDLQQLKGNKGIGAISDAHEQPIFLNSKFGPFCIVTMGLIENAPALVQELLERGHSFAEMSTKGPVNTTELIARLITLGDDLIGGIEGMFARIEGSCSLLILNRDGVYAARDRFGYTPLVIARRPGSYAVASETSAFPNDDFKVMKYMMPGEIVLLTEDGQEGLDLARKELPDAILLDLMLPKLDGYKVCRILKFDKTVENIPVIIFSAKGSDADKKLAEQAGADAYMVKPFDPQLFAQTIQKLTGG